MSDRPPPPSAHKGRGAISNLAGRFERQIVARNAEDLDDDDGPPMAPQTEIRFERAKSILTRNSSPDLPFTTSINPYRGCEHGCIYCFARPTHSYLGLSPGLDFETRIYAKINAPELLRQELGRPGYVPTPIALGVNTDAYQPCERQLRLTRQLLEILWEHRHPVGLISKAALIERDIELLAAMARQRLVAVSVTVTTLDHVLARTLEPRAAAPQRRLKTIARLSAAGIPVSVNIAPVIPFITDSELERVVQAVADAGAISCGYTVLRLPWEVNPLFQEWLRLHFPERAERVMNRIRDLHGGKEYDAGFGKRMKGQGLWADLLKQRFAVAVRRSGLAGRAAAYDSLDTTLFRPPCQTPVTAKNHAASPDQLSLF